MSLFNPHELRTQLKLSERVIGLDLGSRQIGIALSDVSLMLASPFAMVKRGKLSANAKEIMMLCQQNNVGAVVVGLPVSLDGSFGPAARAASDWTKALAECLGLPAALWDERLSSCAVNRFLIQEADMTRKRREEVVDKMAAAYMLQAWIDATGT